MPWQYTNRGRHTRRRVLGLSFPAVGGSLPVSAAPSFLLLPVPLLGISHHMATTAFQLPVARGCLTVSCFYLLHSWDLHRRHYLLVWLDHTIPPLLLELWSFR